MQMRTDGAYIAAIKKLVELMSAAKRLLDKIEAEKICLMFYRDNVTETDTERNNFNTQLLLLEGAKQLARLVFTKSKTGEYELYQSMIKSSGAKINKDGQPDDAFVQVIREMQVALNKNKIAPSASEDESALLELRRKNLKSIVKDYRGLQKRALGVSQN